MDGRTRIICCEGSSFGRIRSASPTVMSIDKGNSTTKKEILKEMFFSC